MIAALFPLYGLSDKPVPGGIEIDFGAAPIRTETDRLPDREYDPPCSQWRPIIPLDRSVVVRNDAVRWGHGGCLWWCEGFDVPGWSGSWQAWIDFRDRRDRVREWTGATGEWLPRVC